MDHCEFVYPERRRQVGGQEILVLRWEDTALSMLFLPFLPSCGGQYRRPSLVSESASFGADEQQGTQGVHVESGVMRWIVFLSRGRYFLAHVLFFPITTKKNSFDCYFQLFSKKTHIFSAAQSGTIQRRLGDVNSYCVLRRSGSVASTAIRLRCHTVSSSQPPAKQTARDTTL